jgi:hypothetical protein
MDEALFLMIEQRCCFVLDRCKKEDAAKVFGGTARAFTNPYRIRRWGRSGAFGV